MTLLIASIITYIIITATLSILIFVSMADGYRFALFPGEIKEMDDLTWVGAIIIFIIELILIPFVYLYALVYFIFKGKFPQ